MATIDELGLTPYQRIMAQMTPTMNPYTGASQSLGGYDPELYRRMSGSGLINLGQGGGMVGGDSGGGGGGDGGGGGLTPPGQTGPNVSIGPDGFYVSNNVNPSMVGGLTGLLGLIAGIPGLGFVGRELANRSNFTNDQATMFGNVALRDTTDPSNLTGLLSPTATMGPTGTGGQASSAAASAAAAASAMGYSNEAIGAASQAAANAAIGGATAAEAAALGSAAAQTVANDIDAVSASQGISPGAGVSDPGETASNAADAAAPGQSVSDSASSAADGYGSGDSAGFGGGTDSGSDGWAKGGKVTKNRLKGPDPKGPDEGYGALLSGEYVIKKSAVKKYGQGLLDMINDGKIPAKKMKSLLG